MILFFVFRKQSKLISYGLLVNQRNITIREHQYNVEQYRFKNAIDSFHYYRKVVSDFSILPKLRHSKFDLYDWNFTYLEFEPFSIRFAKYGDVLQCIKSLKPISISDFEADYGDILKQVG
ncbi:hypothetical protein [Winogradskyella sp.]